MYFKELKYKGKIEMTKFIKIKTNEEEYIMNIESINHLYTENKSVFVLWCKNGFCITLSKEEYNRIAKILLEST